ncbi:MAG: hypothetical protein ACKV2Q_00975 [Planctomycetaceae bacterium]
MKRKVMCWSMSVRIDSRLVVDALSIAVSRNLPLSPELSGFSLVAHSDRAIRQRALPRSAHALRHQMLHEPQSHRLGRCSSRELVRDAQDGGGTLRDVPDSRIRPDESVRGIEVFYNCEPDKPDTPQHASLAVPIAIPPAAEFQTMRSCLLHPSSSDHQSPGSLLAFSVVTSRTY